MNKLHHRFENNISLTTATYTEQERVGGERQEEDGGWDEGKVTEGKKPEQRESFSVMFVDISDWQAHDWENFSWNDTGEMRNKITSRLNETFNQNVLNLAEIQMVVNWGWQKQIEKINIVRGQQKERRAMHVPWISILRLWKVGGEKETTRKSSFSLGWERPLGVFDKENRGKRACNHRKR